MMPRLSAQQYVNQPCRSDYANVMSMIMLLSLSILQNSQSRQERTWRKLASWSNARGAAGEIKGDFVATDDLLVLLNF